MFFLKYQIKMIIQISLVVILFIWQKVRKIKIEYLYIYQTNRQN